MLENSVSEVLRLLRLDFPPLPGVHHQLLHRIVSPLPNWMPAWDSRDKDLFNSLG